MNFDDPRDLGLLQFGLGMLQASGPRPYRQTFGAGLAEGAQQGLNAYQKQKLLLEKLKSEALERQLQQAKLDELKRQREEATLDQQAFMEALKPPSPVQMRVPGMGTPAEGDYGPGERPNNPVSFQPKLTQQLIAQRLLGSGRFEPAKMGLGMLGKGGEGFTLGKDQVRYDSAGNVIATGPKGEQKHPNSYEEWLLAGGEEGTGLPYGKWIDRQNRNKGTNINLPKQNQEDKLYDELAKVVGSDMAGILKEARAGEESLVVVQQLRKLAQQGAGVSGGPVAQWQTFFLGLANQAGVELDTERLIRDQNYRAEATKLVLDNVGSLARATEKEVEMVKESLIDPTKFNSASLELRFRIMEARARRQIEKGVGVQKTIKAKYPNLFPTIQSPSTVGGGIDPRVVDPSSVIGDKSKEEINRIRKENGLPPL